MKKNMLEKVAKVGAIFATVVIFTLLIAKCQMEYQIAGERICRQTNSGIEMSNIGVALIENDNTIAYKAFSSEETWNQKEGTLLANLVGEGGNKIITPGKKYEERLCIGNVGKTNQYVRVNIHKYFTTQEGEKSPELNPEMIQLNLTNLGTDWLVDENASTEERTVLYYKYPILSGEQSAIFSDKLIISSGVLDELKSESIQKEGRTVITYQNRYSNMIANLEVKVDAIQEHNAASAIWSAWGRKVTIVDGILSLD